MIFTISTSKSIKRKDGVFSSSWTEITELKNQNSAGTGFRGSILLRQVMNNRPGLFHFGKIDQLSKVEGDQNKKTDKKVGDTEEHPLRTSIWDFSFASAIVLRLV